MTNELWIEKYRPRTIDSIIIDNYTRKKIDTMLTNKSMNNIIITGVPGIGKTTTLLCMAKQLLGKYTKIAVLEMNASDHRGVKTVESIELFCKKTFQTDSDQYAKHKIVILDEADNMTSKAQKLINKLMQKYYKTTRFAFTCNTSSKIIEAIQGRCMIFRYKKIGKEQLKNKLKIICESENVNYVDSGLDAIVTISRGDMRQAISNLQLVSGNSKIMNHNSVYKICDSPQPYYIRDLFNMCVNKDLVGSLKILYILINKGYSIDDISLTMIDTLKSPITKHISEDVRINFMKEISKTYLIVSKGVDTQLQMSGCIARLCM